jgi:hypothetical protein
MMGVHQDIVYTCDAPECTNAARHVHALQIGGVFLNPYPPAGWQNIGNRFYCDRHDVDIIVCPRANVTTGQNMQQS